MKILKKLTQMLQLNYLDFYIIFLFR